MKRTASLILALALCLALPPAAALAADSDFFMDNGILYQYNGSGGDVTIPSGVTRIDDNAFNSNNSLTSVTIPDGVTSIGFNAFAFCGRLTGVTIPSSVTSIESNAFCSCESLTGVTIPDGVTSIETAVFDGCKSLTDIVIPAGVTSIGSDAFAECASLKSIVIPSGVTGIGSAAFYRCTSLAGVSLPSGIDRIAEGLFCDCDSLTGVTIPSGVTDIEAAAFSECDNLAGVTIPSSVTGIEESAFSNCPRLTDIYYAGTREQWDKIRIEKGTESLRGAALHCAGSPPTAPAVTVEDIPAGGTARASTQTVTVDGKKVEFQMYALLDEKGGATNYIRLRDMAQVLNGTAAQFSVGYDGASKLISIATGKPYTPVGTEMSTPFSGDRAYTGGAQAVLVNGSAVNMTAITLHDDRGGGYNYFKLRDLGKALGFNVGFSGERGVFIESGRPYEG